MGTEREHFRVTVDGGSHLQGELLIEAAFRLSRFNAPPFPPPSLPPFPPPSLPLSLPLSLPHSFLPSIIPSIRSFSLSLSLSFPPCLSSPLQYDVSLPLSPMYQLVEEMRDRVQHIAKCTVGYGHLGDGEK